MKEVYEPIGFMIEGENIIVANPCTIPIEILKKVLKEKRQKDRVTACFGLVLPFPLKKQTPKKPNTTGGRK